MRGMWIGLLALSLFGRLAAMGEESELFAGEEEMLALENEIDALLEEEPFLLERQQAHALGGISSSPASAEDGTLSYSPSPLEKEGLVIRSDKLGEVKEDKTEITLLPIEVDQTIGEPTEKVVAPLQPVDGVDEGLLPIQGIEINLREVFAGSPIIYLLLFALSTASLCVWLYSMLTVRSVDLLPPNLIKDLRKKLACDQFDEALELCVKQRHFFCKMLASGILARKHGLSVMIDTMKAEGKRSTVALWQRIGILNEIAIIAPMLGLLGTVLGMFYAFYDLNRSIESVSLLFDGLGISVGTTVAGLFVAILAMILYSVAKYRLVRILSAVENEAQLFATLIDTHTGNSVVKS